MLPKELCTIFCSSFFLLACLYVNSRRSDGHAFSRWNTLNQIGHPNSDAKLTMKNTCPSKTFSFLNGSQLKLKSLNIVSN